MEICLLGKIVLILDFLSLKSRPMESHRGNYGVWACAKTVKSDDTTLSHLHGSTQKGYEKIPIGKRFIPGQRFTHSRYYYYYYYLCESLDLRIGVIQGASDWKNTAARKMPPGPVNLVPRFLSGSRTSRRKPWKQDRT